MRWRLRYCDGVLSDTEQLYTIVRSSDVRTYVHARYDYKFLYECTRGPESRSPHQWRVGEPGPVDVVPGRVDVLPSIRSDRLFIPLSTLAGRRTYCAFIVDAMETRVSQLTLYERMELMDVSRCWRKRAYGRW